MAERTLIRPSHSPLPLGKLKPKEDSVFPKATVPLSRVHAPSKGFSCLGSEVQTERMRIRSSGFCVTRSGVLVSWPSDLGSKSLYSVTLGLSREVPGQWRGGTLAWGHQTWCHILPSPAHSWAFDAGEHGEHASFSYPVGRVGTILLGNNSSLEGCWAGDIKQ